MFHPFDLPNLDNPAASSPRIVIAGAGSNDGWRGADCWFVDSPGSEPIPVGSVRPAAALGLPAEPLAAGSDWQLELSSTVLLALANQSMTLESVRDAAQVGGAKRPVVGSSRQRIAAKKCSRNWISRVT